MKNNDCAPHLADPLLKKSLIRNLLHFTVSYLSVAEENKQSVTLITARR